MKEKRIVTGLLNESLADELEARIKDYINERNEGAECSVGVYQEIDSKRQCYLWYGGEVAVIQYKGYTLSLAACGDIEGTLLNEDDEEIARVKDTGNNGGFYWAMKEYFETDHELMKVRDRYLILDYCNWWDLMALDNKRNDVFDEVLDSELFIDAVVESIEMLDDYLEQQERNKQ